MLLSHSAGGDAADAAIAPAPTTADDRRRSFKVATLLFITSRLYLFTAIAAAARWLPMALPRPWSGGVPLVEPLMAWDAGWYLSVVNNGYIFQPGQANTGFHPLYPLLIKIFSARSGLPPPLVGVLLSNLALWGTLYVLHRLVARDEGTTIADRATLALAFFPGAVYCSTVYTESLFLLLTLLAFQGARDDRPLRFGVFAALSTATRVPGIVMVGVAVACLLRALRQKRQVGAWIAATCLSPCGLLAFMTYTYVRFGDAFAFVHSHMAGWGRSINLNPLRFLEMTRESVQMFRDANTEAWAMDIWFILLFIAATVVVWRRPAVLRVPYLVYMIGSIALVLVTNNNCTAYVRFVMVVFPAYPVFARWSVDRPWVGRVLLFVFMFLDAVIAALFSRWYWVA